MISGVLSPSASATAPRTPPRIAIDITKGDAHTTRERRGKDLQADRFGSELAVQLPVEGHDHAL
jgi:hypothetical protein